MQVTLRVLSGPHSGRSFIFDQHDTFLIGRSDTAHLCLPDDRFFSRNHCLLEIAPPRCFLRDLGSTNGTYVNGQKVQEAYLRNGDRIQGGQTMLAVEVSADQVAQFAGNVHLPPTQPAIVIVECLNCGARDQAEAASPDEHMTFLCEDCRTELRRRPQPVPGYDMVKVLGRGGMGCVMLARNQETGETVAIKTLLPEVAVSDQALRRFMREIDVASALKHPHIVRFIDRGTNKGVVYLVTEYVEGADAAKLADARGGRLPYQEAVKIISQSLAALDYAHSQGYIHRDIKDQNILVSGTWPDYTSKLTDFGLAKSFTQTGMSGVTMAGDVAGTFAYMPPEQIRDFRNVRPASDIYAMGMTAYSLLTGAIALDISPRANVAETVKAIFEKPIIPIRQRVPEIPESVARVIERAISKDPAQRWPSCDAMRAALVGSS
ncbi:MAG: eukaryotic-like serine/threonine-protein kinase [Acidobacteriota bacterium]|jgi:serine/threonine-protein kinase|nr:eukaryotic-like serine/threonine-protein kinase [Acidobacteriota bacterium]